MGEMLKLRKRQCDQSERDEKNLNVAAMFGTETTIRAYVKAARAKKEPSCEK
jgi:hypothetical protein